MFPAARLDTFVAAWPARFAPETETADILFVPIPPTLPEAGVTAALVL